MVHLVATAAIAVVMAASVAWLPVQAVDEQWFAFRTRPWLDGWARWDAGWYWGIARHGYSIRPGLQSSVAFFPAYPLLMRALAPAFGGPLLAGIAITAGSGLAAVALFRRWAERFVARPAAFLGVLCLILTPFSFFLMGAVYADALFLALALGAFLLLEKDLPVLAGLVGAAATACRPIGAAVVIGLAVRAMERRGVFDRDGAPLAERLKRMRPVDAGVLLSGLGLVAYALLLWARFGDPLAFAGQAAEWGQAPGWRTWLKVRFFEAFMQPELDIFRVRIAIHAAMAIGAICLLPLVVRRLGWGYGAYTAIAIGIPVVSSADFMGMGRYLLAAFPLFAVLGLLASGRPKIAMPALATSALGLVVMSSLFARWNYVS